MPATLLLPPADFQTFLRPCKWTWPVYVYHVEHGACNSTTVCMLEFIHFMFYNHLHVGKSSKLKPEHFVVIYRKEFRLHFSTFLEWSFSTLVKVDMATN